MQQQMTASHFMKSRQHKSGAVCTLGFVKHGATSVHVRGTPAGLNQMTGMC